MGKNLITQLTDDVVAARILERFDNITHVSGHKSNGAIEVRCNDCGNTFTIGEKVTRALKVRRSARCPHCWAATHQKNVPVCTICRREFAGRVGRKTCSEECNKELARRRSAQADRIRRVYDGPPIHCKCCYKEFVPTYGDKRRVFCSAECSIKYERHKRRHEQRIKKKKYTGKLDRDISLEKLAQRDNNVCHICGRKCDRRDYKTDTRGNVVVGDRYPSVDHVLPLANGGAHVWDNVRLAHCKCNRIKSNSPYYERPGGQMVLAV